MFLPSLLLKLALLAFHLTLKFDILLITTPTRGGTQQTLQQSTWESLDVGTQEQ